MSATDAMNHGAAAWLTHTGKDAVIVSSRTGLSTPLRATVELAMSSIDELGTITTGDLASIRASDAVDISRGDVLETQGTAYRIDQVLDSGGYLLRCFVTKVQR